VQLCTPHYSLRLSISWYRVCGCGNLQHGRPQAQAKAGAYPWKIKRLDFFQLQHFRILFAQKEPKSLPPVTFKDLKCVCSRGALDHAGEAYSWI